MNAKELCPICGEGHVEMRVEGVESEYKGRKDLVPMHYKVCDACASDFAGSDESRLNKRAIIAFHKAVDGLLTGAEIRALREKYSMTQQQAARLFGGGPVAFSKYENDDVAHSDAMDALLRLVFASPEAFWTLAQQKGMTHELANPRTVRARVFKSAETNVIYISRTADVAPPSHISQSHRYAAYSAMPTEAKAWKQ